MIEEIKKYAHDNNIPIMLEDGIEFLCECIKEKGYKKILEIGTAIGYSSIMMCLIDDDIEVTTIEYKKERYDIALDNIAKFNFDNRIDAHLINALDYEVDDMYDLIFIDATKSKNILFFEKFSEFLKKGGTIITDNMLFHGLVEDSSLIETKNQRKLVEKIIEYKEYLDANTLFNTIHYTLGDGISVTTRNGD